MRVLQTRAQRVHREWLMHTDRDREGGGVGVQFCQSAIHILINREPFIFFCPVRPYFDQIHTLFHDYRWRYSNVIKDLSIPCKPNGPESIWFAGFDSQRSLSPVLKMPARSFTSSSRMPIRPHICFVLMHFRVKWATVSWSLHPKGQVSLSTTPYFLRSSLTLIRFFMSNQAIFNFFRWRAVPNTPMNELSPSSKIRKLMGFPDWKVLLSGSF